MACASLALCSRQGLALEDTESEMLSWEEPTLVHCMVGRKAWYISMSVDKDPRHIPGSQQVDL